MSPLETRLRIVIDTIPTLAWCRLPDGTTEFVDEPHGRRCFAVSGKPAPS